jgi:hypothetical protein
MPPMVTAQLTCKVKNISVKGDNRIMKEHVIMDEL